MELSYCVVNTNGRELLLTCLEAIRRTHPAGIEHEILVLDNASDDGSAEAVARRFPEVRVIARDRRAGLAENNSLLLREARGRFCLLLNEDSEILEGAAEALLEALIADPAGGRRGAQLLDPDRKPIPCAWRLPGLGTAARPGAVPAPPAGHPGQRHPRPATAAGARGGLGPIGGDARTARGRGGGGLPGPRLLRLLGGGRLPEADARRRLAHPPRARREGDPPRAARHRPLGRRPPGGAVPPRPRDVHAQASLAAGRPSLPASCGRGRTSRARSPPCSCPDTSPAGTGSTPARRFAPAAARGCARPPRPTTPSSRRSSGTEACRGQAPPRSSSRAATS